MQTGHRKVAVIRSREVAAKQGFLLYYSLWHAIGTKVSGQGGRLSGVAVKRGSTVYYLLGLSGSSFSLNLLQAASALSYQDFCPLSSRSL